MQNVIIMKTIVVIVILLLVCLVVLSLSIILPFGNLFTEPPTIAASRYSKVAGMVSSDIVCLKEKETPKYRKHPRSTFKNLFQPFLN